MKKIKCNKCGQLKTFSEFGKDKAKKNGIRSRCKECERSAAKFRYHNDKKYKKNTRKRAVIYAQKRRRDLTLYVLKYTSSIGCVDCGEKDPLVLDLDHVRGKKYMGISQMIRGGFTLEEVKKEMTKCEVRCANCHRRKTAKEREYYPNINLETLTPKDIIESPKWQSKILNEKLVKEIRELYAEGNFSYKTLSQKYNLSKWVIRDVIKRRRWKQVE